MPTRNTKYKNFDQKEKVVKTASKIAFTRAKMVKKVVKSSDLTLSQSQYVTVKCNLYIENVVHLLCLLLLLVVY